MSGYAYHQLAKAVQAVLAAENTQARRDANARMEAWVRVLDGMADTSVRIGARKPTKLPEWVTLEVMRGGFTTGRAKADSPLRPDEIERATRLGIEPTLANIFFSWLTPEGLAELDRMLANTGAGLLFISHDRAVVERMCERIAVMYRGSIVETGRLDQVLGNPQHPYTAGLIATADITSAEPGSRLPVIQDFWRQS